MLRGKRTYIPAHMWTQFFFENAHFAINIFGALVMFAVAWLYFDAWTVRKTTRETVRVLGFTLMSLSFVIAASTVESQVLSQSIISPSLHTALLLCTRLPGFLFIILGLILDPLQPVPNQTNQTNQAQNPAKKSLSVAPLAVATFLVYPVLALVIGLLYLRRATIGLERHLYKVAFGFLLIGASELIEARSIFLDTTNVQLYKLVVAFGPLWILQYIFLIAGLILLCIWVFGYLLKRFETQLFMIFVTTVLSIFLITTVTFTGLLVKNLVDETLRELSTDAKVLSLSIDSKKSEALSDAQVIAQDPHIIDSLTKNQRRDVAQQLATYLLTKKQSGLLIIGTNSQVIANGEDIDRYGYSLSSDPLVTRSLNGESVSSIVVNDGVLSPIVSVKSATPIKNGSQIVGTVVASAVIDNALLDGIKKATGLEASLYGSNQLSATTLLASDQITRPVGTKEENGQIKYTVLGKGLPYNGPVDLLNRSYFAAYLPVTDIDNKPIGMLFVGKPQTTVLETASHSIELTFLLSIVLIVLSVIPSYAISRFIVKQIR